MGDYSGFPKPDQQGTKVSVAFDKQIGALAMTKCEYLPRLSHQRKPERHLQRDI